MWDTITTGWSSLSPKFWWQILGADLTATANLKAKNSYFCMKKFAVRSDNFFKSHFSPPEWSPRAKKCHQEKAHLQGYLKTPSYFLHLKIKGLCLQNIFKNIKNIEPKRIKVEKTDMIFSCQGFLLKIQPSPSLCQLQKRIPCQSWVNF